MSMKNEMEKEIHKVDPVNSNSYFKEIFHHAGIGIITLNENMSILFANMEAMKIFGYTTGKLDGINFTKLLHKSNKIELENILSKNDESIKVKPIVELTAIHIDNSAFPIELSITINKFNDKTLITVIIRDITEFKKNEENLKYQAYFDQLTEIPNRTLFSDRADNAINQAKRSNEGLAIIFIDLDEFKNINDTYGHDVGDIFLNNIAKRFIRSARKSDTVSRRGGDEFTILMPRIKNTEDAAYLAERILASNKKAIKINKIAIYPKTSIGISVYPEDGNTVEMLIEKADKAMYCAKKMGKNRYVFNQSNL